MGVASRLEDPPQPQQPGLPRRGVVVGRDGASRPATGDRQPATGNRRVRTPEHFMAKASARPI
jgi:hypothetical protein